MTLRTFIGVALALGIFGCSPTDAERCEDMDRTIAARAANLPRACEANVDCVLVEVHQGLIVGANSTRSDPELEEMKTRRVELCGNFEADPVVYAAGCTEGMCTALSSGTQVDTDVPDTGTDAEIVCDCSTDAECSAPDLCFNACVCTPLCTVACGNAESCGLIEELRLGSDFENCRVRCEADSGSVQGLARARCLATSACAGLSTCLQ